MTKQSIRHLVLTVSAIALTGSFAPDAAAQKGYGFTYKDTDAAPVAVAPPVAAAPSPLYYAEDPVTAPAMPIAEPAATPPLFDDVLAPAYEPAAADWMPVLPPAQVPAMGGYQQVSLRDAVASGMLTNPEYGVVADNRRATDEELNQAKALYLPSLDFRADTGFEHSDDPGTRGGADGDDEENLWRYDTSLTLTQMLFDGWSTKYENERQKARVESASHRVRETGELVGLAIVESYLEVMRQRELLKIARENVSQHLSILQQIEDSAGVGRSTQADVEQARARVASARAAEASVRELLRIAEASYIRNVGRDPVDLVVPLVPVERLSADVEEEVKVTLHQSPTIDIFESDVNVAHAEYEATKSTFYPEIDLQLNGRQAHDINGIEGRDTSASALVVMNWNLYRGGADNARTREHISREAQAKESRAQAARGVANDVRQTWAKMISSGERARQFAAQADANTEVVKAYMDQFDLNRRTLLDVLDAQNELFVSRSNTVNAEFLEMFAVYRLLALKGDLLAALGISSPRESSPALM